MADEGNRYPGNKGICYIFGNFIPRSKEETTKRTDLSRANLIDAENITTFFKGLSFEVKRHTNLSRKKFVELVQNINSEVEKAEYDSLVVFILTHGNKDGLCMCENETGEQKETDPETRQDVVVPYEDIRKYFSHRQIKYMKDKPRIIFINACRGTRGTETHGGPSTIMSDAQTDELEDGHYNENPESSHVSKKQIATPTALDILIVYSTLPGETSHGHIDRGSWFIEKLIEIMTQFSAKEDMLGMLVRVIQKVAQHYENSERCIPCNFLLNPNITLQIKVGSDHKDCSIHSYSVPKDENNDSAEEGDTEENKEENSDSVQINENRDSSEDSGTEENKEENFYSVHRDENGDRAEDSGTEKNREEKHMKLSYNGKVFYEVKSGKNVDLYYETEDRYEVTEKSKKKCKIDGKLTYKLPGGKISALPVNEFEQNYLKAGVSNMSEFEQCCLIGKDSDQREMLVGYGKIATANGKLVSVSKSLFKLPGTAVPKFVFDDKITEDDKRKGVSKRTLEEENETFMLQDTEARIVRRGKNLEEILYSGIIVKGSFGFPVLCCREKQCPMFECTLTKQYYLQPQKAALDALPKSVQEDEKTPQQAEECQENTSQRLVVPGILTTPIEKEYEYSEHRIEQLGREAVPNPIEEKCHELELKIEQLESTAISGIHSKQESIERKCQELESRIQQLEKERVPGTTPKLVRYSSVSH